MILSEEEAKKKICKAISIKGQGSEERCQGSDCMTYWRWADEAHSEGFCGIVGKPEFK